MFEVGCGEQGFHLAYAAGQLPVADVEQGPEYHHAEEAKEIVGFHVLAAADLEQGIVHPGPEAVFDPLVIGVGETGFGLLQDAVELPCFIEQDHRCFNPLAELLRCYELEVHMEQGIIVEADQHPGLAYMLAGKAGKEIAEAFCIGDHLIPVAAHFFPGDQHQVQVGKFIELVGEPGAANRQAKDAVVGLGKGGDVVGEVVVGEHRVNGKLVSQKYYKEKHVLSMHHQRLATRLADFIFYKTKGLLELILRFNQITC